MVRFTSKALTLQWLAEHSDFVIPSVMIVEAREWALSPEGVVTRIQEQFPDNSVAVRSSCSREDSSNESGAGAYLSVLHVDTRNVARLKDVIDSVFDAYGLEKDALGAEHCFVQPMVDNITMSGVIFTRSNDGGSPYHVINYDDESGAPTPSQAASG